MYIGYLPQNKSDKDDDCTNYFSKNNIRRMFWGKPIENNEQK